MLFCSRLPNVLFNFFAKVCVTNSIDDRKDIKHVIWSCWCDCLITEQQFTHGCCRAKLQGNANVSDRVNNHDFMIHFFSIKKQILCFVDITASDSDVFNTTGDLWDKLVNLGEMISSFVMQTMTFDTTQITLIICQEFVLNLTENSSSKLTKQDVWDKYVKTNYTKIKGSKFKIEFVDITGIGTKENKQCLGLKQKHDFSSHQQVMYLV